MLLTKWKYWELMKNLAFVQLKLKYRGSFLGFLWSLVNPLSLIIVYMVAFKFIVHSPTGSWHYFKLAGARIA